MFGISEPCELHFLVNDWLFIIKISPISGSSRSIKDVYLRKLNATQETANNEKLYLILTKLERYISKLYRFIFRELSLERRKKTILLIIRSSLYISSLLL